MRFSTLAVLGVSAIALSGCSFLSNLTGIGGADQSYHNQSYGSYHTPRASSNCCVGGNALSRWNVEGALGGGYLVGGDAITGSRTNAVLNSNVPNISMQDAYDDGLRAELGGSYALNPNRKITGNVFYQQNESAGVLDWGDLDGAPLTGALSDYESYGAELGLRQYFTPKVYGSNIRLRPYVEGKLGAAKLDDISIENTQLNGAVLSADPIAFYDGGWVPTAAGMVGIETPIAKRMTLGVETGIRWQGKPDSARSDIQPGSPIGGTNNGGQSWTVPLQVRGRYRF